MQLNECAVLPEQSRSKICVSMAERYLQSLFCAVWTVNKVSSFVTKD